ncbi:MULTISPECIES: hypothetical protein [unclassified Oleiphilus]|uniref:hypothetical protein n=1 Tax=unclassified Oleiphilus TaxID=2631174 RepID=UPI0007C3FA5E|nr:MULTISPECIES: hypothetical protein [unclassified Oleiphilus]KZY44058.1 hypothetical protein A3732_13070 [Oleiphilus sp. HI0050]KZZ34789.1 hypothetical protein A3756_17165 [Oleiphilus sp. HI0086]KZZ38111.1 hypothetical protein A3757_08735 [Oleiphilus sp. HI0117]KZZ53648.1 hypothetical protein A3761_02335 [Oleiphilus sp. HI0123]
MNEIEEKKSRLDHALAQLIVHAPDGAKQALGPEASLEELAALAEGKLSKTRKHQIYGQFENNQNLYETWLAMDVPQEQMSSEKAESQATRPSRIEMLTAWFAELFSWQGALTASMGIFVGAIGMLISHSSLEKSPVENSTNQLAINAPLDSPQKAKQGDAQQVALLGKIKCYAVEPKELSEFCVSNTLNTQHWLHSNEGGLLKAIPSPYNVGSLMDVRVTTNKIALISSNDESNVDLIIASYQFNNEMISYETIYQYSNRKDRSEHLASAIEIKQLTQNKLTFKVLRKDGQLVTETYNF